MLAFIDFVIHLRTEWFVNFRVLLVGCCIAYIQKAVFRQTNFFLINPIKIQIFKYGFNTSCIR